MPDSANADAVKTRPAPNAKRGSGRGAANRCGARKRSTDLLSDLLSKDNAESEVHNLDDATSVENESEGLLNGGKLFSEAQMRQIRKLFPSIKP